MQAPQCDGASLPQISVVVPTYRRPHFLAIALRSLQRQTFADYEVLVCDNAADDETRAVVEELHDERFRYIARPTNIGMVANVYDGLRRARGIFVMKFDDDDEMEPHCLETLVTPLLADPALAVSGSDMSLIDVDGRLLEDQYADRARHTGRDRAIEGIVRPFTSAVSRGTFDMVTALIRASALDWTSIDERASTAYDLHLLLNAAQDGKGAHYSRERLVRYRQHEGSDSATRLARQTAGALFAREQALAGGQHIDVEILAASIAPTGVRLARALLREGRNGEARQALARTRAAATDLSAWRLWVLSCIPAVLTTRILGLRARSGR